MPRVINIADKLKNEKPWLTLSETQKYPVNNTLKAMFEFQSLSTQGDIPNMKKAIGIALGEEAAKDIILEEWTIDDYQVLNIGIMAAMRNMTYEEAESLFRRSAEKLQQ